MKRAFHNPKRQGVLRRGVAGLILISALGAVVNGASNPGYLAVIGPAPIRFLKLAAPSTNHFVLPKPPPEPAPVSVAPVKQTKPLAPVAVPTSGPEAASTNQAVENTIGSPVVEPTQPDAVISPQMLMRFFNKSTNGSGASIVAPMEFTPPKSSSPNQSSATYSTSP